MPINEQQTERYLESKSKLVFQFPTEVDPGFMLKTLHFMENIQIEEKVTTNYAQYTPIGSNGSQFAYLGSKSREFDLSFNMTLPHIMESTLIKPEVTNKVQSKSDKQLMFWDMAALVGANIGDKNKEPIHGQSYKKINEFIRHIDRQHDRLLSIEDKSIVKDAKGNDINVIGTVRETALTKIMFWVNLIRASCITNSRKPYMGPPIIRLHHGILYNDIPCLVNNYSITYDQMNGFDSKTMLPRVISVKLSLKEVRLRGVRYSPGLNGDYMPGWDSMFVEDKFVTLDPEIPRWKNEY